MCLYWVIWKCYWQSWIFFLILKIFIHLQFTLNHLLLQLPPFTFFFLLIKESCSRRKITKFFSCSLIFPFENSTYFIVHHARNMSFFEFKYLFTFFNHLHVFCFKSSVFIKFYHFEISAICIRIYSCYWYGSKIQFQIQTFCVHKSWRVVGFAQLPTMVFYVLYFRILVFVSKELTLS